MEVRVNSPSLATFNTVSFIDYIHDATHYIHDGVGSKLPGPRSV
jgi:hypothetical protein